MSKVDDELRQILINMFYYGANQGLDYPEIANPGDRRLEIAVFKIKKAMVATDLSSPTHTENSVVNHLVKNTINPDPRVSKTISDHFWDEENMKLDAKNIPLPGYFTSNPTEPKPLKIVANFNTGIADPPTPNSTEPHPILQKMYDEGASPKEELELEAIRHLIIEAVTPYTFGDDGHLTGLADKDCYQWIDAIIKDVMFKFTRQAAIKELNKLVEAMENDPRPIADWYGEPFECVHDLVNKRITELKADNE